MPERRGEALTVEHDSLVTIHRRLSSASDR